jgi:hypothetical protein
VSAIQPLNIEAENRRKLFRIADPEFANMKVYLFGRNGPQECTCLDISALGIGVLVPLADFETVAIGIILEFELQFGPLSPVRGLAIVSNRYETGLHDERGPLLRLGLRFSDANQGLAGYGEQAQLNRRRSSRYRIPEPLQPLCACNDPLWFGEVLTITIFDLSSHGLSGEINAKRTVLTEGLRTVFRIAFPHGGVYEVPTRIIYANPTDSPNRFRIGCEFVRRPAEFLEAFRIYTESHAFTTADFDDESNREGQVKMPPSTPGHIGVVTHFDELISARDALVPEWALSQVPHHVIADSIVCRHPEHGLPRAGYFILELYRDHASEQVGSLEEEPQLGKRTITLVCENFQSYPVHELRDVISFALYVAVIWSAQTVSLDLSTKQGQPDPRFLYKLKKIGIEPLPLSQHPDVIDLHLDDVWHGHTAGKHLLVEALLRMAHLPTVARVLDKNLQGFARYIMLLRTWLRRSFHHSKQTPG